MIRVFKRIKELLDCPAPVPGKVIGWDAQGNPANLSLSAGAGDVTGPVSAVDSNLAAFDTATGKLIKDSGKKITDLALATHTHTMTDLPGGLQILAGDGKYYKLGLIIDPDTLTPAFTFTEMA